MSQSGPSPATGTARRWLLRIAGLASLLVSLLFLLAVASLAVGTFRPGAAGGTGTPIEDNWLVLLYKLNAGYAGVTFDCLRGPGLLDLAIMALVTVTHLGLYASLRRTSRGWSAIAAAMPPLGMVIFLVTGLAGRSAVMGAGLVVSCVMLRSRLFTRAVAAVGIVAALLLLVGDFGTTEGAKSAVVAACIGIGYMLLTAWFAAIGRSLMSL